MTKIAFVFPGQGAQQPGMGCDFHEKIPACRDLFSRSSDILGFDLAALAFEGPEERLRPTENAQPALFVTAVAALKAVEPLGIEPSFAAGHSIGEYAALVACKALDFETALRLVQRRAALMAETGRKAEGGMVAVLGLDAAAVEEICAEAASEGIVVVANYNCPGQTVISGETAALMRAGEIAKTRGARRVLPLNVSGAFHSPLVEPAARTLAEAIAATDFQEPSFPPVANSIGEPVTSAEGIRAALSRQMAGSVRWEASIRRMMADGVDAFIELGVGEVLSGLIKRIDKTAQAVSVQDTAGVKRLKDWLSSNRLPDPPP
ncbi:MAG: ACP S-malonyltransferase [Armatimonadetes bacterium]|nr:ACP S-malonyltransferase [Armatimonadota bacterium]